MIRLYEEQDMHSALGGFDTQHIPDWEDADWPELLEEREQPVPAIQTFWVGDRFITLLQEQAFDASEHASQSLAGIAFDIGFSGVRRSVLIIPHGHDGEDMPGRVEALRALLHEYGHLEVEVGTCSCETPLLGGAIEVHVRKIEG